MEFWNDMATNNSWKVLIRLKKEFEFVLIGGWACYLLTKTIKSRDIDVVVDFQTLENLRKRYSLKKTGFLRKYEMLIEQTSIDVYVPFYSKFPLPAEEIENGIEIEGFRIPRPEVLLILKQNAEFERGNSVKGQKDRIDIINLLINSQIDVPLYKDLLKKYSLNHYLERLRKIVRESKKEYSYLGLTDLRKVRLLKEKLLKQLS
jgi:hypothetical protein